MTVNFAIKDNYALTYEERHIDLHNNFNFVSYDYKVDSRLLTLTWTKSSGIWVDKNELPAITLIHKDVFFINISYDNKKNTDDDKCLDGVSFFTSLDRKTNNALTSQSKPSDTDDIIYFFTTDHFIRVACDKIDLILSH